MNSDVYINGNHLGNHPYGYTQFSYNITPYLKQNGGENILAVRVSNEGRNSRWYSGSGIYRHVWLTVMPKLHMAPWGVYVTTPEVTDKSATINVATKLTSDEVNPKEIILHTRILDAQNRLIAEAKNKITNGGMHSGSQESDAQQTFQVSNPQSLVTRCALSLSCSFRNYFEWKSYR